MNKMNVIAIDGPAASGKSSVATAVAEKLHGIHINTGSMYRAVALKMLTLGITPEHNPEAFAEMLAGIRMRFTGGAAGNPELEVDGAFPGEKLRTPEVSAAASAVAVIPAVRRRLVELQRAMAAEQLLVMEGRDIGTAVFPDACCKIFLTASPETRARRRLLQDGSEPDPELLRKTAEEIAKRDLQDSTRAISPLKQAEDAAFLDNSALNLEQTADAVIDIYRKSLGNSF